MAIKKLHKMTYEYSQIELNYDYSEDELSSFFNDNELYIRTELVKCATYMYRNNIYDEMPYFELLFNDTSICSSISADNIIFNLTECIKYFELIEEYEFCDDINKLIDLISKKLSENEN